MVRCADHPLRVTSRCRGSGRWYGRSANGGRRRGARGPYSFLFFFLRVFVALLLLVWELWRGLHYFPVAGCVAEKFLGVIWCLLSILRGIVLWVVIALGFHGGQESPL